MATTTTNVTMSLGDWVALAYDVAQHRHRTPQQAAALASLSVSRLLTSPGNELAARHLATALRRGNGHERISHPRRAA
jgi:hypothetical protein